MSMLLRSKVEQIGNLEELWEQVGDLNRKYFPENGLAPILGGGQTVNPKVMFVFINPTARNISSDPAWEGPRFPFIGTKPVWRVFHQAGFFRDDLMEVVERGIWSVDFALQVQKFLEGQSLYLTNLVKWTGPDGSLPDRGKISLFLPLMIREVEIVAPKYIVTFGSLPFECLTGQKITLSDYYDQISKQEKLLPQVARIGAAFAKVIPCYFPVGRGDPARAIEILKLVEDLIH